MKVEIKRLSEEENKNICLFSKDIFESLNLSEGIKHNIHLGQSIGNCSIGLYDGEDSVMAIPEKLFDEFSIFDGLKLNIRKENIDIYLGPVVGIFINHNNFPYYEEGIAPKYNGRAALFHNCLFYYFSIYDVDWENGKVKGYTLVPKREEWVSGCFPIPDIIYDRGLQFEINEKPLVKELRKKFKNHPKIKIVNTQNYLGKKVTHEKLSRLPKAAGFLPRTVAYTNFNDVIMMLKQYDFLFLKASHGSMGREVLSIEKEGEKYKLTFYYYGLKVIELNDIEELRDYVEKYTEGRQYIIQQGIRLLKYNGNVFDMRVVLVKNGEGKWRSLANWGRIARENLTITNTCAGGSVEPYEDMYPKLIKSVFGIRIPDVKEIERDTIAIAEYIEKAFGSFGELGMDIGIDMHGRLWFIEANTVPDNYFAVAFDYKDKATPQNLAVFEYIKYLAGFND